VTLADKLSAFVQARLLPIGMLERRLGLDGISPDDLLTIIFTSGSTGDPKGVMLSHENIGSNVQGIGQAVKISSDDVAIGVMPFFHSYGYTATMWTVLTLEPTGVYHFDPRDAHQVGKLARDYAATIFMTTPTFLRIYLRRCEPQDFASLDVVFGAAEKVPAELFESFEAKFGVRPLEAYGCTELSPLVAVNVPSSRLPQAGTPGDLRSGAWHGQETGQNARDAQEAGRDMPTGRNGVGAREGSVGRPIPGVKAKVVNAETWQEMPAGEPGMLLVSGPSVMKGYLNQPEATARVIRDGWYITGDLATIDTDGFITITGRESRFSKLGGEMVPHGTVEEALEKVLEGDADHVKAVVTAIPDPRKGERLVVLHLPTSKTPEQIRQDLAAAGLPNLWIPSQDSFVQVDHIPVLGTGKLDLKAMREVALARFTKSGASA
jgi:acyl-[acyl-carrier-protein]-phospholipid O-acyltransferase/long-chain-fatty-acid--[acyl-carrier-protein] ligase